MNPTDHRVRALEDMDPGAWDAFCAASDDAWFFHTTTYQDYAVAYRPDWSPVVRSFALVDDAGIAAACPIIQETVPHPDGGTGTREFGAAYGGMGACPLPALRNDLGPRRRLQVLEAALGRVDALAREHGVSRGSQRVYALAPHALDGGHATNPLPRHGYLDTSLATQVIDLDRSEDNLWHGLSKGHRHAARRGARGVELVALDGRDDADDTGAAVEAYRMLHAKAAGRVPRPRTTYDLQARWLRGGDALLVGARRDGRWLAFAYLIVHKSGAYYMSGCEDPGGERDLPVGHAVQWHAIKALRERGVSAYEVGWQHFGPQPHAPATPKDVSISAFKRRFGGRTVPLWSGERFCDRSHMVETLRRRIDAVAADHPQPPQGRAP